MLLYPYYSSRWASPSSASHEIIEKLACSSSSRAKNHENSLNIWAFGGQNLEFSNFQKIVMFGRVFIFLENAIALVRMHAET